MHRLDLVVGPNGAGKTTFITTTLQPLLPASRFVNADILAAHLWPEDPAAHAYDAARAAADTRAALIKLREPFIAETVFSHPSKIDLIHDAHKAGYVVILHVLLVPEELTVRRVEYRVQAGGHRVPKEKVRARYRRLWDNVAKAIRLVDSAAVYDNSRIEGPRRVATFSAGVPVGAVDWPNWTPSPLLGLSPRP